MALPPMIARLRRVRRNAWTLIALGLLAQALTAPHQIDGRASAALSPFHQEDKTR